MNILFYFEAPILPNKGGVQRVTHILANEFVKYGHNISYLCLNNNFEKASNETLTNINQFEIDHLSPNFESDISKIINDNKIDLVINQSSDNISIKVITAIKKAGPKIISVYHNQPFPIYGKEFLYKSLFKSYNLREMLIKNLFLISPFFFKTIRFQKEKNKILSLVENSDKLILLSNNYISRIKKFLPELPLSKLSAINNPNTFDKTTINDKKENIVLMVCRLYDPQKNITGFLNVWKKIHKLRPDWKAIILGDGPDKEWLEKYSAKQNLNNIEFYGNQQDVQSFYSKAKIICMTSLYEGWPMVLPEAIANGCVPFLFNSFESAEELVCSQETGIIIEPFKEDQMVEKLLYYTKSEQELILTDMGKKGSNLILNFNKENITRQWLETFNNL